MKNTQNFSIGIIGLGQIGSALKEFIGSKHHILTQDLDHDYIKNQPIDYLHICIPYSSKYLSITTKFLKTYTPKLTIIHTTTKPGTTHQIHQQTKLPVVHVPFIGIHPSPNSSLPPLSSYFSSTKQIIGPTSAQSLQLAQKYLSALGIDTLTFDSSLESELAKILSTTYYAWNIIFEKFIHQLAQQQNANFDQIYTQFNQLYNKTYSHILPQVTRPVLTHQSGPIGGHCVIPNTEILHQWLGDEFTQFILNQNKNLKDK